MALVLIARPESPGSGAASMPLLDPAKTGTAFAGGASQWALQVAFMAWIVASATMGRRDREAEPTRQRAAWLVYVALVSLAIGAASLQALVLVWAALGVAERWVSGDPTAPGWPVPVLAVSSVDVVGIVFLLLVGGLGFPDEETSLSSFAWLGLLMACATRVLVADRAGNRLNPPGRTVSGRGIALAGSLPAFALMARSSAVMPVQVPAWVAGLVSFLLLATALIHSVGSSQPGRRRSWVVSLFLLAMLVALLDGGLAPLAFGAAGSIALTGAVLWPEVGGRFFRSVQAATGALLSAGLPSLAGAVLVGLLAKSLGTAGWVGMVAMALLASRFWKDASFLGTMAPRSRAEVLDAIGIVVALGASTAVFLVLRETAVAWAETLVVLGVSFVVGAFYRVMPATTVARFGRAFRLPDVGGVFAALDGGRRHALRAIRGLRDVLEGDASLLWAFVIVLIAFLALRQAAL